MERLERWNGHISCSLRFLHERSYRIEF